MARRDKTGPMGMGPMTGRGLGDCSGSNMAKAAVLGLGGLGLGLACRQGFKRGMGGGTRPGARAGRGGPGRGMGFFSSEPNLTPEEMLTSQKELLQERIDLIDKELENL